MKILFSILAAAVIAQDVTTLATALASDVDSVVGGLDPRGKGGKKKALKEAAEAAAAAAALAGAEAEAQAQAEADAQAQAEADEQAQAEADAQAQAEADEQAQAEAAAQAQEEAAAQAQEEAAAQAQEEAAAQAQEEAAAQAQADAKAAAQAQADAKAAAQAQADAEAAAQAEADAEAARGNKNKGKKPEDQEKPVIQDEVFYGDIVAQKPLKGSSDQELEKLRLKQQPDFTRFCWRCDVSGISDQTELQNTCVRTGFAEACYSGNDGCFVEQRKNDGEIGFLSMGCMSTSACNSGRNDLTKGKFPQCKPTTDNQSYCQGCCNGKEQCNLIFMAKNGFDPTFAKWLE